VFVSAERVALQSYWRHEVLASDHRPVSATFAVCFERVDRNRRSKVRHAVQRGLDGRETQLAPCLRTSSASLALGTVAFASLSEVLQLVLTNEGILPTVLRLCASRLAPWLGVYPPLVDVANGGNGDGGAGSGGEYGGGDSRVVRGGGDKVMRVTLAADEAVTVHVAATFDLDCRWAAALTAGEAPLSGRLVFVSADALPRRRQQCAPPKPKTFAQVAISGEYTRTALGLTLSLLSSNTSNFVDAAGGPDGFHSSGLVGRRRSSGWDRSGGSDGGGSALMGPAATDGTRYPLPPQLWHLEDALLPAVTPGDASLFLRDGGELTVVAAVPAAIDRGEHAALTRRARRGRGFAYPLRRNPAQLQLERRRRAWQALLNEAPGVKSPRRSVDHACLSCGGPAHHDDEPKFSESAFDADPTGIAAKILQSCVHNRPRQEPRTRPRNHSGTFSAGIIQLAGHDRNRFTSWRRKRIFLAGS